MRGISDETSYEGYQYSQYYYATITLPRPLYQRSYHAPHGYLWCCKDQYIYRVVYSLYTTGIRHGMQWLYVVYSLVVQLYSMSMCTTYYSYVYTIHTDWVYVWITIHIHTYIQYPIACNAIRRLGVIGQPVQYMSCSIYYTCTYVQIHMSMQSVRTYVYTIPVDSYYYTLQCQMSCNTYTCIL